MTFTGCVKLPKEYNNGKSVMIDLPSFEAKSEELAREKVTLFINDNHQDINIKDCIIILKEIEE